MSDKIENPFAFPLVDSADGMTLRDYFAAKALVILSPPNSMLMLEKKQLYLASAIRAYEYADAMLKARSI